MILPICACVYGADNDIHFPYSYAYHIIDDVLLEIEGCPLSQSLEILFRKE